MRAVHADAHPHLLALGPVMRAELQLYVRGSCEAGPGRAEDRKEAVARGADLTALVGGECLTNDAMMLSEHGGIGVAEPRHLLRRALDVSEEKGQGLRGCGA